MSEATVVEFTETSYRLELVECDSTGRQYQKPRVCLTTNGVVLSIDDAQRLADRVTLLIEQGQQQEKGS